VQGVGLSVNDHGVVSEEIAVQMVFTAKVKQRRKVGG
jgi:nicotinamide mononucleotide (NMN) deamidase PncC